MEKIGILYNGKCQYLIKEVCMVRKVRGGNNIKEEETGKLLDFRPDACAS